MSRHSYTKHNAEAHGFHRTHPSYLEAQKQHRRLFKTCTFIGVQLRDKPKPKEKK